MPMQRSSHEHGFAAASVRIGRVDFGVDDLRGPRRLGERRRLADEVAFVRTEESRHVRFEHVQLVRELGRPRLIAFLDAHAVDRVQPVVRNAESAAAFPKRIVQSSHRTDRRMQLEAQLADVTHAQRPHGVPCDADLAGAQPGKFLVPKRRIGQRLEQLAGTRPARARERRAPRSRSRC